MLERKKDVFQEFSQKGLKTYLVCIYFTSSDHLVVVLLRVSLIIYCSDVDFFVC